MPWSSNATFLVEVCLDGATARGIYKPHAGERPLWDFPDGLYRREVAAYGLGPYRLAGRGRQGLLFGYATLDEAAIVEGVEVLADAIAEVRDQPAPPDADISRS